MTHSNGRRIALVAYGVSRRHVRHYYVTPKNYLDFIATYKRALTEERTKGLSQKERLSGGLEKLIQAATEVDAMQKELSEATVVVERATVECNALLEVHTIRNGS